MTVIELKTVGKRYERGGRPFWALRNASLTVAPGEFVTLFGRSGSGKSTLLNILVGLLKPTEGDVLFDGKSILGKADAEMSAIRNSMIGYVPQGAGILSTLTVLDNVRLPWYLSARGAEPEGRAQELLETFGLGDLGAQYPSALSGGELRRVAIARALMCSPRVIVADEPTSSLDRASAANVVKVLRELADKGTSVLMVTHDESSFALTDRFYEMEAGCLSERPKA